MSETLKKAQNEIKELKVELAELKVEHKRTNELLEYIRNVLNNIQKNLK